jgi:hypothetical protein
MDEITVVAIADPFSGEPPAGDGIEEGFEPVLTTEDGLAHAEDGFVGRREMLAVFNVAFQVRGPGFGGRGHRRHMVSDGTSGAVNSERIHGRYEGFTPYQGIPRLAPGEAPGTMEMRPDVTAGGATMLVVCAWCGTTLSGKEGPVSHGICDGCSLSVERAFHRSLLVRPRAQYQGRHRRARRGLTLPLPGFAAHELA